MTKLRCLLPSGLRATSLLGAATLMLLVSQPTRAESFDPAAPSPESVLGYSLGERITDYAGMERYLSALAQASPRVAYGSYGDDYEGRALRFAIVSSASNIERLDSIKAAAARLTDAHTLDAGETAALVESTPLVIWLNYCVDGNETAGLESALQLAHHLASSPTVEGLLEQAVVVMTPMANPSSHERWAAWSNSFAAGPRGNDDPLALEHNPAWGVLTNNNHYLVDLNRESVWATQRESAALRQLFYAWNPVVVVDHHGEYDDFTGPGYEEPLNPLFTPVQRRWLERFGRAIGRRFQGRGWSYSPWETGSFYPGYWESIGGLNGAISFTYETTGGGSRGLRFRREDGSVATLRLAADQHTQASLAVIEEAVAARKELVRDFADFWRSAFEVGEDAPQKVFLVDPTEDPARAESLIDVLLANRVEVFRTSSAATFRQVHDYFGGHWQQRDFGAGIYAIPVGQRQARLVLTMLRKDFSLPEQTLREAEIFRRQQEKPGSTVPGISSTSYLFYDVTAWSMPLTYGVAAFWAEESPAGSLPWRPLVGDDPAATSHPVAPDSASRYGYVFPGRDNRSMALLIHLLQEGVVLNVAYEGFSIGGTTLPRGSVLMRNERNPDLDLHAIASRAAERFGVPIRPLDSVYSDRGPSMGSESLVFVRRPKVAVLAGDPVDVRSFGNLWFVLERLYEMEFTAISREQLDAKALSSYDVLVLPDGDYGEETFSTGWLAELRSWVRRGGTLVCLRRASRWAAHPDRKLSSARLRAATWPPEAEGVTPRRTVAVPGAILRAIPDEHHYLTMGYRGAVPVLVRSNLAFEPGPGFATPLALSEGAVLRLSGFAYPDSLERLAGTPYLMDERVESGHLVLFLDDPNFRVYWSGLARLFLNSILLSPSF